VTGVEEVKTTIQYEIIEHPKAFHDEHWCIRIAEGEYEGVVYQYDTIEMKIEETEEGDAVIKFDYIKVDNPNDLDLDSNEFVTIIGDILTEFLQRYLEETDEQHGTGGAEAPVE